MNYEQASGRQYIYISLIAAMALTIMPLPTALTHYRPEWVALVLLFWTMVLPHRVGIATAWVLGLALDVLKGALLGQHALALTVLVFMMQGLSMRMRLYPFWQQSVLVGFLLVIYQALLLWIYDMTGNINIGWSYWAPFVLGALLWPWTVIILRDVQQRYRIR